MFNGLNHNLQGVSLKRRTSTASDTDALQMPPSDMIRHLYVHIPFCARICPYCAFYKEKTDRAQSSRFCEAIVGEISRVVSRFRVMPHTIFFGGGTPTALT